MTRKRWLGGTAVAVAMSAQIGPVAAQAPGIVIEEIAPGFHKLTVDGGWEATVLAFTGPDGLLVVDSGFRGTAEALETALDGLGHGRARYLVSTHSHKDHTGGNNLIGRYATVIAHAAMPEKLEVGSLVLEDYTADALPDVGVRGEVVLRFNGEDVVIRAVGGAHDVTDVAVWFRQAGIAYLGDLAYGMHFPSTDYYLGSLLHYPDVLGELIEMLPDDVRVVSGHGRDHSHAELVEFREMLTGSQKVIREDVARGMTAEEIVAAGHLEAWARFSDPEMVGAGSYVASVIRNLSGPPVATRYLLGALYEASKRGDGEAIRAEFERIRATEAHAYGLDDPGYASVVVGHLYQLAGRLVDDERPADALGVYGLIADAYPAEQSQRRLYRFRAEAEMDLRDFAAARASLERALELEPRDSYARDVLDSLGEAGREPAGP